MATRFQKYLEESLEASEQAKFGHSPEYKVWKKKMNQYEDVEHGIALLLGLLLLLFAGLSAIVLIAWTLGFNTFAVRGCAVVALLAIMTYGCWKLNKRLIERKELHMKGKPTTITE